MELEQDTPPTDAYHIMVSGVVQGVCFRNFVQAVARFFGVEGTVENVAGDVEIYARGGQIEMFLQCLKFGPRHARVDDLAISPAPADHVWNGNFTGIYPPPPVTTYAGQEGGIAPWWKLAWLNQDVADVHDRADKILGTAQAEFPLMERTNKLETCEFCGNPEPELSLVEMYGNNYRLCRQCIVEFTEGR